MMRGRSGRDFVRQTRLGIKELKKQFDDAPISAYEAIEVGVPQKSFFLNDIGVMAVVEEDKEATRILMDSLNHKEREVRYVAAAFLGDISHSHPNKHEAHKAISKMTEREKDDRVRDMALRSKTSLKKKLGGNRSGRKVAYI